MSECVLRMDLRENCLDCDLHYIEYTERSDLHHIQYAERFADADVYCYKEKRHVGKRFGPIKYLARPDWCPILCQLPEGHGRLVEAKALFERVYEYYGQDNEDNENWMMGMINGAPTIVPADTAERTGSLKDCWIPTEPPARHAAGQTEV